MVDDDAVGVRKFISNNPQMKIKSLFLSLFRNIFSHSAFSSYYYYYYYFGRRVMIDPLMCRDKDSPGNLETLAKRRGAQSRRKEADG